MAGDKACATCRDLVGANCKVVNLFLEIDASLNLPVDSLTMKICDDPIYVVLSKYFLRLANMRVRIIRF